MFVFMFWAVEGRGVLREEGREPFQERKRELGKVASWVRDEFQGFPLSFGEVVLLGGGGGLFRRSLSTIFQISPPYLLLALALIFQKRGTRLVPEDENG
jgi:hypothetical protein